MKRYLPFLIVGAVALITFGSGLWFYRSTKTAAPTAGEGAVTGLHVRGAKSASVTLEEFGDFQCPPCGLMATVLEKEEQEYARNLRVVFHHFPLAVHAHAREAALAAEAAHNQGHFWEMHDLLYKEQMAWAKAENVPALFDSYAEKIGLDVARFKKDLQSPEVAARVDADQKLGSSRGVTSTPTMFVNNVLVPAIDMNPANLHKKIEEAVKGKPKS